MRDDFRRPGRLSMFALIFAAAAVSTASADDEALIFTPPGFEKPGAAVTLPADSPRRLTIRIVDAADGRPTPCRVNVVGPDGQFYQPAPNRLTPFSLTGDWPKNGKGNRPGKGPFRYFGRFFYTTGEATVAVPPGKLHVEAWKGPEFAPASVTVEMSEAGEKTLEITLKRVADMSALGYESGDTHLHFPRTSDAEESLIFDLLAAEDIRYGSILGYNEPAGPYTGVREKLDMPQLRGLGRGSEQQRGPVRILSGQEYRSRTYGHLNLYLRDDLVREGENLNADNYPIYGMVGRETREKGGVSIHAHGGYAMSIYADFVQGDVQAVELLQFGVYRGIELADWYRILNIGYRFPAIGSSDYPACRRLGDCLTYALRPEKNKAPDMAGWLRSATEGRSFVTTGPLLLLEVDGHAPGDVIAKTGPGPVEIPARVRLTSPTARVQKLQWIVNGEVVEERTIPEGEGQGGWFEASRNLRLTRPSWIAVRAFGATASGQPDAEAHTNPVFVHIDGKAPYDRASLDALVGKLDGQLATHRARNFAEKAKVLDYFQKSRDILLKIRERGGLPSAGVPADWLKDEAAAFDPSKRAHTDDSLAEFLKPLPPRTPQEAMATIEVAGGFRMELVAAEPMVRSPVAAAYDENGDLYVAEMTDYPYKPRPGQPPLGSIRWLHDADGDGRMDESRVFADKLLWAAGIAPWKGGVFVTSPPDIWYLKDTDGDHVADVRRKVYTGFGTENEQGMLNNLTFALDHKIYGSTSTNGGVVRRPDEAESTGVSIKGRDFRFDPVSEAFEPITGTVQFGTTFDDFGNRFLCSESRPLVHAVLPLDALARNPYLPVPTALENVSGNPVPIFRISPIERWRQIRSSRRIAHGERSAESAGASHHVVDAAAGVTIYRGGAYSDDYNGDAFVCDAQNNLIHHMKLDRVGSTFKGHRVEKGTEFVRSYDNWFRPVNLVQAPDGTLNVLDMSRETIEAIHIPLDVVKHLDLRRGRDQGRIYRIVPPDFQRKPAPNLGDASTADLVAALSHPDAWRRDTAHRLLFERQDRTAVEPLRALARSDAPARTRILALWSLRGLDALSRGDLLNALNAPSPEVLDQALILAEERIDDPDVLDRVMKLTDSRIEHVRFRAVLTLGASGDARVPEALATAAFHINSDQWMQLAVLASSANHPEMLLKHFLNASAFERTPLGRATLDALLSMIGAANEPAAMAVSLSAIDRVAGNIATNSGEFASNEERRRLLILALARGLNRTGKHFPLERAGRNVQRLFAEALRTASNAGRSVPQRLESLSLASCAPFAQTEPTLKALLDPATPSELKVAAIRALAGYNEQGVGAMILSRYAGFEPAARSEAVAALLSRELWTVELLQAAAAGKVDVSSIEPVRRETLLKHKNEKIAEAARQVFGADGGKAGDLGTRLAAVLKKDPAPAEGEKVFKANCMTCHRLGDRGHAVGPDLTATQFGEPESMLTHILEPNRYVDPKYVQYLVSDRDGRVYTGLIASETASSLTLRRAEGVEDTILRGQIDEMTSTGKSLMPEDLAARLTDQQLADVAAFLLRSRGRGTGEERLDIGTLPGLVEPEARR